MTRYLIMTATENAMKVTEDELADLKTSKTFQGALDRGQIRVVPLGCVYVQAHGDRYAVVDVLQYRFRDQTFTKSEAELLRDMLNLHYNFLRN